MPVLRQQSVGHWLGPEAGVGEGGHEVGETVGLVRLGGQHGELGWGPGVCGSLTCGEDQSPEPPWLVGGASCPASGR